MDPGHVFKPYFPVHPNVLAESAGEGGAVLVAVP